MTKKAAPKSNYVIELSQLVKRYGFGDTETYAVDAVDLSIKAGEFVIIMGPSGCGKTTLLNVLGLLDNSMEGSYLLDGIDVSCLSLRQKAKIRNRKIGFIFQNFNLVPRLTVIDNVALPLLYAGEGRTARLEKASQILSTFHLSEREYYMPWQLSGGQIQRVAIARALVNDPAIILADEPTGNLDSKASHIIMEELYRLNQAGNTIIMVTHNPNLTSYADRVLTMLDGKIVSNKDNNSGDELVDNNQDITIVEEVPDSKISQIIVETPVANSNLDSSTPSAEKPTSNADKATKTSTAKSSKAAPNKKKSQKKTNRVKEA